MTEALVIFLCIAALCALFLWAIVAGENPNYITECQGCGVHYWTRESTASYKAVFHSATCETTSLDKWRKEMDKL